MIDIIILSNAKTVELSTLTANTIDSILKTTNDPNMQIIVMEQCEQLGWDFLDNRIKTIYPDEKFNYNRFANLGAKLGTKDWIMIANNDLIFKENWLDELLKANHPIVSPRCPVDKRQLLFNHNTQGIEVGKHLSGWCFMISRSLWKEIGGFDEDFSFWCADNSLMEQLMALGVLPMLVPKAIVEHLGSRTLKTASNRDELTVDQVKKYNLKYGRNLFNWGT